MNRIPKPGEQYRHFKNKLYQIIAVATHSETGEQMVVYQALYGDFGIWVRPLSMFLEPVDRKKYPDAAQEYRFELVKPEEDELEVFDLEETQAKEEALLHHLLSDFLDTDSYEERLAILQKMKGKVGQREVDSLCFCLDVQPGNGEIEEQLDVLKQYLKMQQRYDASRLRRS